MRLGLGALALLGCRDEVGAKHPIPDGACHAKAEIGLLVVVLHVVALLRAQHPWQRRVVEEVLQKIPMQRRYQQARSGVGPRTFDGSATHVHEVVADVEGEGAGDDAVGDVLGEEEMP